MATKNAASMTPVTAATTKSGNDTNTTKISNNNDSNDHALEPDVMTVVLGNDSQPPIVTQSRKEQLLMEARADRRRWVYQVPFPYSTTKPHSNDIWSQQDQLSKLQSNAIYKHLPSATKVLSQLYGMEDQTNLSPDQVAERIIQLVGPLDNGNLGDLSWKESDVHAQDDKTKNDPTVRTFRTFWSKLLKPECAMLVQGMRNFITNISTVDDMERLSNSIKSYTDSTFESLKSHIAWKDETIDDNVRHALESFLYGQARFVIETKIDWSKLFTMTQQEWSERIQQLQFVMPVHLEINCLNQEGIVPDEILQEPIKALMSVDHYFSPYEKLQRVLAIYKGVNAALSKALNHANVNNNTSKKKLPTADDVLPTIILTVLRTAPTQMFRNLYMVETFCPPEYLRGEAGYAYTNLYGAVQFITDLDFENPSSLSISQEEFRKGLNDCKIHVEAKQKDVTIKVQQSQITQKPVDVNVQDVRKARLQGQIIDFKWACQWQDNEYNTIMVNEQDADQGQQQKQQQQQHSSDEIAGLPAGFHRSYSFLGKRAEDIRISDIPRLLSEYQMLVHATEGLLGERAARLAAEKQRKKTARQQAMEESAQEIELLNPSSRERALTS